MIRESKCECEPFQSCEKCRVDLSKPGVKNKTSKIKNKSTRLHNIKKPKETHCRFCGEPDDGTCYFHHCEIPYLKIKYGSGTGKKIDDNLTVWAHHKCGIKMSIHPAMSFNPDENPEKYSTWEKDWLLGIIETHLV